MKIKFAAKAIYNKIHLRPGCDKSEALYQLLNREIKTSELNLLSKMGFEVDISGDRKEFAREMEITGDFK